MTHILFIIYPEERRRIVEIPKKGLIIGRGSDCDLQLDDEYVSDKNCKIYFENGHLFIEDLNSTNKTIVNGSRVKKCALVPEQNIEIGATVMKYKVMT